MEFVAFVVGVLAGALWASMLSCLLHHPASEDVSPTVQLLTYFLVAMLTGMAVRVFEKHVAFVPDIANGLSIGLMAGVLRSSWYVPRTRLLRVQGQRKLALGYLLASPALAIAGLLAGYSSVNL